MGKVVRVDLFTLCLLLSLSHGHHLTLHLPYPGTSLWPPLIGLLLLSASSSLLRPTPFPVLALTIKYPCLSTSHLFDSPPLVYL
ncbi:hypothetical protein DL96DRAFT_1576986 [Flagelloscypha sp. PMI_526]|nr:hypothetical protein DL96DRAFT_1576986 [Flagelloscypha sp. PMI_526]